MIDELSGLATSLGLPITPEEQDEALEAVSTSHFMYTNLHTHARTTAVRKM